MTEKKKAVSPTSGRPKRGENARMTIPALLHLTRLGYAYLPGKCGERDPETGILTEVLRKAVERINGKEISDDCARRLMDDLRHLLGENDLGEGFYRTIRDGWNGLQLIDFRHPGQNRFQAGAEIACGQGRNRFRPDITLFINGLPLAMMEVKDPEQRGGILAEYDRMRRRYRQESFRRYLQAVQVWIFSNDAEPDGQALLPRDGVYYTTASGNEFPVYPGPGRKGIPRVPGSDRKTGQLILEDFGMREIRKDPEYRRWIAADTPTHRMLTGMMAPERFLRLLRYGIRYSREAGPGGPGLRKRILTWEEMETLRKLDGKIRRGARNWTISCPRPRERVFLGAAVAAYLSEKMPGCRMIWISGDETEKRRTEEALRRHGAAQGTLRCMTAAETCNKNAPAGRRTNTIPAAGGKAGAAPREATANQTDGETAVPGAGSIYFLPAENGKYRTGSLPRKRLRKEDPDAILITIGEAETHEGGNYTYLLQCADGSLYCGWTSDLEHRVRIHNAGQGAKYTRSRLPVKLVYWEEYDTREEAMRREWQIKQMRRKEKEILIQKQRPQEAEN